MPQPGSVLRIDLDIEGSLPDAMGEVALDAERAVTRGMRKASGLLKAEWRAQVAAALGVRVGNAVRAASYPKTGESLGAAAQVYTRAPLIAYAHEHGALIRGRNKTWLAIPTPEAGVGPRNSHMTPAKWMQRHGRTLRFIHRPGDTSLLVAEGKFTKSGRLGKARMGKRGWGKGTVSVVMFILVRQVKLPRRLNLMAAGERVVRMLPELIVTSWPR